MGGASGADIKSICTEAGMFAIRESRIKVSSQDFFQSIEKVVNKSITFFSSIQSLFSY